MKNLFIVLFLINSQIAFTADAEGGGTNKNATYCYVKADGDGTQNGKADSSGTGNKTYGSGTGNKTYGSGTGNKTYGSGTGRPELVCEIIRK